MYAAREDTMRLRLALLAALVLRCGGSLATLRAVANTTATLANAGGHVVLVERCAASMAAIGRVGTLTGDRCVESGPRAGTPATSDEERGLADVRDRRRVVMDAAEAVRAAHDVVTHALDAGSAETLPAALAALALSYGGLVALGSAVGLALPATTAEVTP